MSSPSAVLDRLRPEVPTRSTRSGRRARSLAHLLLSGVLAVLGTATLAGPSITG